MLLILDLQRVHQVLIDVNKNGNEYIAYCWKSVAGFSNMGSYSGTGEYYGNYCKHVGFQPELCNDKSTSGI